MRRFLYRAGAAPHGASWPYYVVESGTPTTSITIRSFDDVLKRRLRARAVEHGRSMEEEARDILRRALSNEPPAADNLADAIRRLVEPGGGFELPRFARGPIRDPPDLT